jgi:3-hydroxy-9,10-secoandrosta-1,3,5(10)-triene-9,17-dione monooxygenase reductase component
MTEFSAVDFRSVMGRFCSGVVIVTGLDHEQPVGFTAQSFLSLSLQPPLIGVCPAKSSTSWPRVRRAGHFGINILSSAQKNLCARFAAPGGYKFEGVHWRRALSGSPILNDVIGFVDCRLEAEHEAGDHTIAVGRVIELRVSSIEIPPLLFFRGVFGAFGLLAAADAEAAAS